MSAQLLDLIGKLREIGQLADDLERHVAESAQENLKLRRIIGRIAAVCDDEKVDDILVGD